MQQCFLHINYTSSKIILSCKKYLFVLPKKEKKQGNIGYQLFPETKLLSTRIIVVLVNYIYEKKIIKKCNYMLCRHPLHERIRLLKFLWIIMNCVETYTFVPIHRYLSPHDCARDVCAQTCLCPYTFVPRNFVPRHICAQTHMCPDTDAPRHDCAQTHLCPHIFVPGQVCAQTRLWPDTFVLTHVCAQTGLCPNTFVPWHVIIVWSQTCLGKNVNVCVQTRLSPDTYLVPWQAIIE